MVKIPSSEGFALNSTPSYAATDTSPAISVQLSLDAASYGNSYFILDKATRGVLDNTTYTLGGEFYTDITTQVLSLNINRGRSRELDRFATGAASVTFKNLDRTFDPTYTSSTLYPNVVPRRPIRILSNGTPIFTGVVDDWSFAYEVGGRSEATANCVDGFALLSKQTLNQASGTAQTTGTRIAAILARPEVNWPLSLEAIDNGQQTLQADAIAQDTNALQYLQLVESSEPGSFFINGAGLATFKDRNTAASTAIATFSDDGTNLPYTDISVLYGTELLYNRVVVTRAGGAAQTAQSTTSQTTYGISSLDQTGLLIDNDTNSLALANYLLAKYQNPELRFDTITFELAALTLAQQNQLLGIEITNNVTVQFQPNQTGPRISQTCQVIGISHSARPETHTITFQLAATDGRVAFVLNSTLFGVLDSSTLGF